MKTTSPSSSDARERYLAWERSAGSTLAILVLAVAASLYVHIPSALFAIGNLLGGIMVFFAWRSTMKQHMAVALALVLAALVLSLVALSIEVQQPIQVLLAQGLGLFAVALFACILFTRSSRFLKSKV